MSGSDTLADTTQLTSSSLFQDACFGVADTHLHQCSVVHALARCRSKELSPHCVECGVRKFLSGSHTLCPLSLSCDMWHRVSEHACAAWKRSALGHKFNGRVLSFTVGSDGEGRRVGDWDGDGHRHPSFASLARGLQVRG